MEKRIIAIVGTGSMASAVGWSLAKLGFEFYFIGRSGPIERTYSFNADGQASQIKTEVPKDLTKTSLVFYCVKSYDLAAAFQHLELFSQNVIAVSLANGAVNHLIESGQKTFKQHIFRPGFSTVAVNQQKQDEFTLRASKGEIQFGPLKPEDQESAFEKTIISAGAPFIWNPRILLYQRRKWLFNTVINTLTAAKKLPCNGDLLVDMPLLAAVFDEAHHLGEELWGEWRFARNDLFAAMLKLIEDTSSNENSMAADVRSGRRTESLYLAGLAADKEKGKYPLLRSLHSQL